MLHIYLEPLSLSCYFEGGISLKQNIIQNIIGFILKYIWIFCALLIILELVSVTYTASILMQQSVSGIMKSVSGEVSGRVDGVLRMLNGMAADERFADSSKPLFDRAIQALPYQESYNLYMIALTDENVNVISADEKEPPKEEYSLAYRDYMQRLYATGEYQITDAMLSGDGKDMMNYTIAVPIINDGKVEGSVFGSIYFDDIEDIVDKYSKIDERSFYLLGVDNKVMAGEDRAVNGETFLDLSSKSKLWGSDVESINELMLNGGFGEFWEWGDDGLNFVTYQRVDKTDWTILYRVKFISVFMNLFPVLFVKISFFILMCVAIHFFGRRYLSRHLEQVNHLINRMADMQKELFQSEKIDYDNLLELTQQGLTDQLTGLATRTILFKRMFKFTSNTNPCGAVMFIDLDDLKRINDNFGHDGGDCALLYFAQVLKEYEAKYNGVAARYGGDEFILVFNEIQHDKATEIAELLCTSFNTTITTKEHSFAIHGSIGVSFYPEHGDTPEELICKADLALYSAKQNGKNRCAFFTNSNSIL